ncbi:conserved hypothetical protein [Nitrosomonas nitrosa]|uniref:Capsule synthesis protein CapA domain-containing protein n=1 Tax=Nitrosomonas nitrosa TaxID=52442 RepID=A0A8H8YYI3_9PROT|nr:CapA family protein [Nitrosomonas nitrosa]CAE6483287.1 conserved hypothetical protein [Nitrosomonas nitrosa]
MIFTGDVAIAHDDYFRFLNFPSSLLRKLWCLNLEGAVIDPSRLPPDWGIYNSSQWINSFQEFTLTSTFIGNNHILDVEDGINITEKSLSHHNLETFGAGKDKYAASKKKVILSGNKQYLVIGFGWSVIGCHAATSALPGVNSFEGQTARRQATEIISHSDQARVIVVIHGNYEFERYPQPAHRKLAFQLIDLGVYAVIFHHPHIVGPVERYKGRTIAYSLGNWAFSYGKFFGGKLCFPESSFHQIALEIGEDIDTVHHARFSPPATVNYEFSESVNATDFSLTPVFEGFSHDEYTGWFKKNRLKRKLLPIYREPDNSFGNWIRDHWVAGRQILIDTAVKSGVKAMRRSA